MLGAMSNDSSSGRGRGGLGPSARVPLSRVSQRATQLLSAGGRDPGASRAAEGLTLRERLRALCQEALDNRGRLAGLGAVSRVAAEYSAMDPQQRGCFFELLLEEFSVDPAAIDASVEALGQAGTDDERGAALIRLSLALESPRQHLFRQFNTIPESLRFLVDLRADLLPRVKAEPRLRLLEFELRHILESWFNIGFLELVRLTWDSPAALLEKLVDYEAVHQIQSWDDLKWRLTADRACYAFTHPAMPGEPVIFVEVALVQGLSGSVQELLQRGGPRLSPEQADTAVFYSITNAQRGLRGIPFGNLLIKLVTARLRAEVPSLQTFATLSPLPSFRADALDPAMEDDSLSRCYTEAEGGALRRAAGQPTVGRAVRAFLASPTWSEEGPMARLVRPGLMRAAALYLAGRDQRGRPRCPVARFHGSNGAVLARIHWPGDTSQRGLERSAGVMVNYLYDLDHHEQAQRRYAHSGALPLSAEVRALLAEVPGLLQELGGEQEEP